MYSILKRLGYCYEWEWWVSEVKHELFMDEIRYETALIKAGYFDDTVQRKAERIRINIEVCTDKKILELLYRAEQLCSSKQSN